MQKCKNCTYRENPIAITSTGGVETVNLEQWQCHLQPKTARTQDDVWRSDCNIPEKRTSALLNSEGLDFYHILIEAISDAERKAEIYEVPTGKPQEPQEGLPTPILHIIDHLKQAQYVAAQRHLIDWMKANYPGEIVEEGYAAEPLPDDSYSVLCFCHNCYRHVEVEFKKGEAVPMIPDKTLLDRDSNYIDADCPNCGFYGQMTKHREEV